MKKIDLAAAPVRHGTRYPPPYDAPCRLRERWRLGQAAGLTQFGVNQMRLPPGAWSSQRHWHSHDDEFVMVLAGEVVLVTDAGEETFRAGDSVGFRAGDADGHHFQNRSDADVVLLEVGTSHPHEDRCTYSDINLISQPGGDYTDRDGAPFETAPRHF